MGKMPEAQNFLIPPRTFTSLGYVWQFDTTFRAETAGRNIDNTMLVTFDNKFIRRGQKQRRNGEACRASPM